MLVDQQRGSDHLPAVPGEPCAKNNGRDAVELLHPSLHALWNDVEHQIGPDMAVGANQLARYDHDRPDHQIDDGLLGIADGILRKEIARHDLPEGERQCGDAEHTGEGLLGAVPNLQHPGNFGFSAGCGDFGRDRGDHHR